MKGERLQRAIFLATGEKSGDRIDFVTAPDGSVTVHPVKSGILALEGMAKPIDGRRRTLLEMDAAIAAGRHENAN